jgi:hypothetical protein
MCNKKEKLIQKNHELPMMLANLLYVENTFIIDKNARSLLDEIARILRISKESIL